ncbi:MAG: hypothetical protein G01um101425_472 [Candidatus Peregrinibacteria bacterium Gr01-1014_25]|nr:MAG: hypothetical protein G01um101425_472 [Candidatus Peregrinibacteria bacterium Gr01-1014_25]
MRMTTAVVAAIALAASIPAFAAPMPPDEPMHGFVRGPDIQWREENLREFDSPEHRAFRETWDSAYIAWFMQADKRDPLFAEANRTWMQHRNHAHRLFLEKGLIVAPRTWLRLLPLASDATMVSAEDSVVAPTPGGIVWRNGRPVVERRSHRLIKAEVLARFAVEKQSL